MKDNKITIPKISKKRFWDKLKKRKLENTEAIKNTESLLLNKRGYIIKMPKKGSSIILLISGGVDSVVLWKVLLSIYKYNVYPVFFHRGSTRYKRERKRVYFFYRLFKKIYPELCRSPFELSITFPPKELENEFNKPSFIHEKHILNSLNLGSSISSYFNLSIFTYMYPFLATAYSNYLFDRYYIKIPHIFSAINGSDGLTNPAQTFTSLRTTMLDMCLATNNYQWQFFSPFFEKEIGNCVYKHQVIKIGEKSGLSLEKTWSCYKDGWFHCGTDCYGCILRRDSMSKAGVADKTIYFNDLWWNKACNRQKIKFDKLKYLFTFKDSEQDDCKKYQSPTDIRKKIKIKLPNW